MYGNGVGGLSNGGFMVTNGYRSDYPSYALDPASQNDALITPAAGNLYYYSGGVQRALSSGDFGRVIADFQTDTFRALVPRMIRTAICTDCRGGKREYTGRGEP